MWAAIGELAVVALQSVCDTDSVAVSETAGPIKQPIDMRRCVITVVRDDVRSDGTACRGMH